MVCSSLRDYTVNIYRMIIGCLYVNADEIPTTGKSCSLYRELLHPILGIPLASIGKLPFIGKLPIDTKAIPGIG